MYYRIIKWNTESKENVWGTILSEGGGKQKCTHDLDYGGKKENTELVHRKKKEDHKERPSLGDMI